MRQLTRPIDSNTCKRGRVSVGDGCDDSLSVSCTVGAPLGGWGVGVCVALLRDAVDECTLRVHPQGHST